MTYNQKTVRHSALIGHSLVVEEDGVLVIGNPANQIRVDSTCKLTAQGNPLAALAQGYTVLRKGGMSPLTAAGFIARVLWSYMTRPATHRADPV